MIFLKKSRAFLTGFLLLFCAPLTLFGSEITLEFLKDKPKGITRDFYIWQFLNQEITPKEANEAYALVHKINTRIFGRYFKKTDNKTLSRKTICERMELSELLKQEPKCIGSALKLSDAAKFSRKELKSLSKKLEQSSPALAKQLWILASKEPLKELLKGDVDEFVAFFENVGHAYRIKELNRHISAQKLESMLNQNHYKMGRMAQLIILNPAYTELQKSLAKAKEITQSDDRTLFYLGLNALTHNEKETAITYFKRAKEGAKDPFFIARAQFWQYLATGEKSLLEEIAKSRHPNIYSIYATQTLGIAPSFEIVREVLDLKMPENSPWDIQDPFAWLEIEAQSKASSAPLSQAVDSPLRYKNTESHLALILQREARFQKHFFITPYRDALSQFTPERQALIYAIARQESLFIPTAISTSYALGVMQLMPFNVEAIAKKLNENRALTDMFNPELNIKYAEIFLRDLEREFKNPLLISYAYNGGPGFLRRLLERGDLFKKNRALDPWYSLEMIPYEESRYYGARVMANYIIYQQGFGTNVVLKDLLDSLLR